jgi:hypothetical protein
MKEIEGLRKWRKAAIDVFWGEIAPCDHIVQIYENDKEFLDTLESFVTGGLKAGESTIVIATDEHLAALNERLRNAGFDLFSLTLHDQYIPLSAEETLAQFMINDWPDENLFHYLLTNLLLRARKRDRKVRAFGEMVALLWAKGFSGATVRLEHLWTRFCESEEFGLFCAYPKSGFTENPVDSIAGICRCHSKMIASVDGSNLQLMVAETRSPKKVAS